jgi:hypothetical protein
MRSALPELHNVKPDDPLRLAVAAAVAYPDRSMTASGLRREAARGRLVIERTAGKDYITLADIAEMRRLCRGLVKVPTYGSARSAAQRENLSLAPFGSSSTAASTSVQDALKTKLKLRSGSSPPISWPGRPGGVWLHPSGEEAC